MRLEQLQYFVQIVECHSFNKASQKLHITQPALTNAVKALEEELGVLLLVRGKQGVVPTSRGVRVYEDCRELLTELNAKIAAWKASGTEKEEGGTVPLVASPSACNYLVEGLLPRIREEMRNIDIVLHEATFYEFYDFLRGGHAHVGVTAFIDEERDRALARYRGRGFAGDALLEDEYRVFLSSEHPLAAKDELTSEDCGRLEFATYSNQYNRPDSIFSSAARQMRVTGCHYLNSRESIMQVIAQNRAAGLFLHRMTRNNWYVRNGLICAKAVHGLRLLPSRHYLMYLEDGLNIPERRVADFIREHYGNAE